MCKWRLLPSSLIGFIWESAVFGAGDGVWFTRIVDIVRYRQAEKLRIINTRLNVTLVVMAGLLSNENTFVKSVIKVSLPESKKIK